MSTIAEFLPWDSDFFGVRIGQAQGNRLTGAAVQELERWAAANQIDCLYFLADSSDPDTIRTAEDHQFRLRDIRVTLGCGVGGNYSAPLTSSISPARPEDIPELRRIAAHSHENSRFFNDRRFPRDRCTALYETWIERSCNGYAGAVLVFRDEGKAQGYITCDLRQQCGRIGLLAVDAGARGKGSGSALIAAAVQWFQDRNAHDVTVVTQGANTAALRMYERSQFVTRAVELWYHRWFTVEAAR